jgi:hypothetical protein
MTPSRNESYICNSKPLHKRTCIFEKLHLNPYFHTLHSISHNSTHTFQLLPLFATFKHLGCHTDPYDQPQKGEKGYITEEQVRHIRNQRPASSDLLKKYEYQYQQRLQRESEDEEYERHTGKSLKKLGDTCDHWHCPFFKYCWDSGMSRLPTVEDCPECRSRKCNGEGVSVFRRLGPVPP